MFGGIGEEDVQRRRLFGLVGHRSPPAARTRAKTSLAGVHCWPPMGEAREAIACPSPVPETMSSRMNSARAAKTRKTSRPRCGGVQTLVQRAAGCHRTGADILADVIYEGTTGMDEGAPTTARLRDVLNRAGRVVIAEGSPDEADSTGVARIVVTGAEIAELARVLSIVDGGTGDRCLCNGWPRITVHDVEGKPIACWTLHHQSRLRGIGDCDATFRTVQHSPSGWRNEA
ncbi:hypothetical protein [Kitasatospora sp. NPDC048715]|uniref:hypothetical protein n=1 Tax=Kitasatospora sp. NPDC048715 TaxID=3364052 RepID=UPI00371EBE9E